MGGGRGGWYSWDWLDNNGKPSAARITPGWQSLDVGQQLKGPANWWTVAVVEPDRTLVLRSSYGLPPGRPSGPRSGRFPGRGWPGCGAFICVRLPAAGPGWWSAPGAGAAPGWSPGRSACWWGNRCTSSCRPASSATCAPGSPRRRNAGLPATFPPAGGFPHSGRSPAAALRRRWHRTGPATGEEPEGARGVVGAGAHQQPRPLAGELEQYQGPGEVEVGADLAQLLLGPLRGVRVDDVDRAAAPRMADRAVGHGMLRVDAQHPKIGRITRVPRPSGQRSRRGWPHGPVPEH